MLRPPLFESRFAHAAGVVRRALALRHVLDVTTAGALAGAVAGGIAWLLRAPWFLAVALGIAATALLLGVVRAARRRWSDTDVALFLDARLGCNEAVSTALEWRAPGGGHAGGGDSPARKEHPADVTGEVTRAADAALDGKKTDTFRPRVTRRLHASLPLLLAALGALAFVPPRALPPGEGPAKDVVKAKLDGLKKVEPLASIVPASKLEKQKLEAIAEAARQLAADAEKGVERKVALDALDKLRAQTMAERKLVPDASRRAGIDAAARALSRHPETAAAARALERTDLVALDEELERLADTVEARSREIAAQALEEAAAAARARGAGDVASVLEEQQRLLKKRSADSAAMKELGKLLGDKLSPEGSRQLSRLNRGDAESAEALAQAMVDALKGLSEEERKRVAEALQKSAQSMASGQPMTAEQMKALAKALSGERGQADLKQALKQMASRDPSAEAAREAAISAALLGISEAQQTLSSGQSREPGQGPGNQPGSQPGAGPDGPDESRQGVPSPNGGPAAHHGSTPEVSASSLPARAAGTAFGGVPMGRAPGSSPGTARKPLTELGSAPGAARPGDVAPVTRSDVPKEYRDQVGRYFAP
jgi:hypothetical protein